MSLINEMLRNLDARNAADSERAGLARNVRALPQTRQRRWPALAVPLAAALLGGVGVWLGMRNTSGPIPAPVIAISPALPAVAVAMPEPPPPVAEEPKAVPETTELKLATRIDGQVLAAAATPKQETAAIKPIRPAAIAPIPSTKTGNSTSGQISKSATDGSGSMSEQAEAEYRRGYAAIRRGAVQEAGDAFRAALKVQPGHTQARQALLSLLVDQRLWQDAETLAFDGVSLHPSRSDWALLAARIQFDRGEVTQAQETLAQSAAQARQNPDYQVFHALLLQRANRHAEAIACYQTALALRPAEGRWWYGLGRVLDIEHRETEARLAYEKARDSGNLPQDLAQNVERRLR